MMNKKRFRWTTIIGWLVFVGSFINILVYASNLPEDKDFLDSIIDMGFLEEMSLYIIGYGLLILVMDALVKTYEPFFARDNRQSKLIDNAFGVVVIVIYCYFLLVLENLYWKNELVFSISKLTFFYGWYGVTFVGVVIAASYILIKTGIVKIEGGIQGEKRFGKDALEDGDTGKPIVSRQLTGKQVAIALGVTFFIIIVVTIILRHFVVREIPEYREPNSAINMTR